MGLNLTFFGPFQAALAGQALTDFRSGRVQNLLIYLVLEAASPNARPQSRTTLATLLWPDEPERAAKQNLRQTLYQLRQLLGEPTPPFLLITNDTVQWNPAADYHLDVADFLAQMTRGALSEAVQLYTGDLLTGLTSSSPLFEEWLLLTRERFHLQALEALDRLTQLALQQETYSDAQGYARRQLALEPWRETAHQQLMRALALAGDRSAALAQYEQCRRLLADELAVEPGAETVALYQAIRIGSFDKVTGWQGDKVTGWQGDKGTNDKGTNDKATTNALVTPSPCHPVTLSPCHDWGEAPERRLWYGRQEELAQLTQWVMGEANAPRVRLVTVLGMGGMGKTTLAVHLAHHLADQFDVVIWRSLVNAPPLTEILRSWLQLLDEQPASSAGESFDAQLNRLFTALRNRRCLLVLDNAESIMQGATQAGRYQPGYEVYGQLFKRMGESSHQSCLLITSREQPQEVARLERTLPAVRTLLLSGLPLAAGATMLTEQGLHSPPPLTQRLIAHYSGNPLALLLVAETIQELFDGDVAAFLQTEAPLFDDIRDVLDQHFARLSPLERDILLWLAIEREALTPTQINENFPHPAPKHLLLDAITSLRRRALLEKSTSTTEAQGDTAGGESNGFTLQNVVTEYVTEFLINEIGREIDEGQPVLLKSHALLKAGGKEYVRQSQARLLLQPVIDRLIIRLGRQGLITRLRALPAILRQAEDRLVGYGGGNVLNLLRHLGADLSGMDFSQLAVWQAYLPGAAMPGASFAGSDLRGCLFADTFGTVVSVAFHPNGKVLAAGTANDGKIRLWRLADAHCLAVLEGHTNIVWTLAFSPDGNFLVSGSEDHTIALWQVDEAIEQVQRIAVLTSGPEAVWHLALSADGRWLASGSGAGVVRLWDWRTKQLVATLRGHTAGINVVAFSPNGRWCASSGRDCTICLWDVEAAAASAVDPLAARLQEHQQRVWSLAFSPDSNHLASGGWDGALYLWDLTPVTISKAVAKTTKAALPPPRHLKGHTAVITTLAFLAPDQVVSTSEDHTIRLWDTTRGEERANRALQGYNGNVWYTAISADGQWLAGGGGDQSVRLWNLRNGDLVRSLHGHAQGVMALAVTPDGNQLAAAYQDYTIRLWDMTTHAPQRVLVGHTSEIESLAFAPLHPDKKPLLASGGSVEQNIQLWDVVSGQRWRTLEGQNGWVYRLAFHPSGDWLASVSIESLVRLWSITPAAVTLQETLRVKDALLRSVAFAADGTILAAGSTTGVIYLWQQQRDGQWRFLTQLTGHSEMVTTLAFSPDGEWLASGSYDRTICLWHWRTGALVQRCQGHSDWVWQVAFQPQAVGPTPLLASCSSDNTVRLWDVASGQALRTLSGHTNWVRDVAFSPDGATLISGSSDETIKWWEVTSGACLATLRAPRPYEGVSIADATSLTAAQRLSLKALGAID